MVAGTGVNFITPMAELVAAFEASSDERVRVSSASTGVLYAAIRNGAGYAAFMAADSERPRLLEAEGLGVPGTAGGPRRPCPSALGAAEPDAGLRRPFHLLSVQEGARAEQHVREGGQDVADGLFGGFRPERHFHDVKPPFAQRFGYGDRVFRALVGETLAAFVKRVRLERALYLMSHEDKASLTSIALRCGFSADLSGPVGDRALFHCDNAYFYPAVHAKSAPLYTNTSSAFIRGAVPVFQLETTMFHRA